LAGRVDMPFSDLYGVARQDDMVLVANGHGGVQVVDASNLAAPYRVGFIKPDGFARDVAIHDGFALIAASHQGLVVADLRDPTTPIVASLDTLGVANRLFVEGSRVYVADMAGDGQISQLNVISIADPFDPRLERTIALTPARRDLVADGVYDLHVAGGKAYVTVHYSDQQDAPARGVVEVIDLGALDEVEVDATIPAVTHRPAAADDFGGRGMLLARGGLQVAAGRGGIAELPLPGLTVLDHQPALAEQGVSTDLDEILIELSAPLPAGSDPTAFVRVQERHPLIGEEITDRFAVALGDNNRYIRLTRTGASLTPDTQYYVTVLGGLQSAAGATLRTDHVFDFITSPAGNQAAPNVVGISPAVGPIAGGTPIVVSGEGFGSAPELWLGGQPLVIEALEPGSGEVGAPDQYDRIHATTVPNFAGPASVQVIHESGLSDTVLGAFTYVDLLQITFIDPAVVSIDQNGDGDVVDVVGFGFHDGVQLRAYPSGQPDGALVQPVDNEQLVLVSAERMRWRVPSFDADFRGFVDVEIFDDEGRRFVKPRGLFYGGLEIDTPISVLSVPGEDDLVFGQQGDTGFMPPGTLVDLATDAELGYIFVLGRGDDLDAGSAAGSIEQLEASRAPGWISIVHYDRDSLADASPVTGFGYFNLPAQLVPSSLTLSDQHLYVSAAADDYVRIDPAHEDDRVILVYDRETRAPEDITPSPEGADRDIRHAVPIAFDSAPTTMAVVDDLLFAGHPDEGLAVLSLADPLRPSVIRILREVTVDGERRPLEPIELEVVGKHLHVAQRSGDVVSALSRRAEHVVFDASRPSLPLLGARTTGGPMDRMGERAVAAYATGLSNLTLYDLSRPENIQRLGRFDPRGFGAGAGASAVAAQTTLASVVGNGAVTLFDASRPDLIGLLDAVSYTSRLGETMKSAEMTDDGVIAGLTSQRLLLVDSRVLDLVGSNPPTGSTGVPTGEPLELRFSRALTATDVSNMAAYVRLAREDGSAAGEEVGLTLALSPERADTVVLNPDTSPLGDANYRIELLSELGTQRSEGLFDHVIRFATASDASPAPRIVSIAPRVVNVEGGTVEVLVDQASAATGLLIAGQATEATAEDLGDGSFRFVAQVPPAVVGPASLEAVNPSGARDSLLGALEYAASLSLTAVQPAVGSSNGGTTVLLTGEGFRPGAGRLRVFFGGVEVPESDVTVLDSTRVEAVTPVGVIGPANVTVELDGGASDTLVGGFEYQQPAQSNIVGGGRIYDAALDATGTYLVAAAGGSGVVIYNVDASTFTGDPDNPLNEDALRRAIDLDGDGRDDRIVAQVPVGGAALGVSTYFERGVDRVLVTTDAGELVNVAFDPLDPENATILDRLPLHSTFARGIDAENSRAAVAMAERGLGLVDIFHPTKAYLTTNLPLPGAHAALDVAVFEERAGFAELYAVTAGEYSVAENRLESTDDPGSGGFYIVENDPLSGAAVIGSVAVPSSRVALQGDYAYLATGDEGVVIVDVSNPAAPRVVSRLVSVGHVYDLAVDESTLYLARGALGLLTVDITNPLSPTAREGLEAFASSSLEAVVASDYAGIGAGATSWGAGVVQVSPDAILRVSSWIPDSGILDRDASGDLTVRVRFNKSIEGWPDNLARFSLRSATGEALPATVDIVGNDAVLTLLDGHGLLPGDPLSVAVGAGVASVAQVSADETRVLYRLEQDQRFPLVFRGSRPAALAIDAVVPRRVQLGERAALTVSARGVPSDPARLRAFVGEVEVVVTAVQTSSADPTAAILQGELPGLDAAGQYDVTLLVDRDGIWESTVLRGGLMVDAPIAFTSLSPRWGPGDGGTTVTIVGQGFEPGTSVSDGVRVRVGDLPVLDIRVLSTELLEVVTPGGSPGLHGVHGEDRYGGVTSLLGEQGFGYGLREIASVGAPIYPTDVHVDPETGVAITSGGYLFDYDSGLGGIPFQDVGSGLLAPDNLRAAVFDIQDRTQPVLVGGAPGVPDPETLQVGLQTSGFALGSDSIRLLPVKELEEGTLRKRLYVASGPGGVTRLNLDEQNGLQLLGQELADSDQHTGAVGKAGHVLLVGRGGVGSCEIQGSQPCYNCPTTHGKHAGIELLNYVVPEDPVEFGPLTGAKGGEVGGANAIAVHGPWVFSAGLRSGVNWNTTGACGL
ncbi:MAG: IPT/TIG domain-containing protein, partial [Myxococcales bacterium]